MTIAVPEEDVWLVGAGPMARDHADVLDALKVSYEVIGRGCESAETFEGATGKTVHRGGIDLALAGHGAKPSTAIVAVGVEVLAATVVSLVEGGVRRLLVEKPGAIDSTLLAQVAVAAGRCSAEVVIGYNRRYYAATAAARSMISEDGGAVSCGFELSEWPHATEPIEVDPAVRQRWLLAHSSHVVDLAFHLCGRPKEWSSWRAGSLPWHPAAARFAGSGLTDQGVTFSYHGDWEAPGRWGLDVLTRRRRLTFRPMEELRVTEIGSLAEQRVDLDDELDRRFKPGLLEQTRAFILGDRTHACTLNDQIELLAVYETIGGYR